MSKKLELRSKRTTDDQFVNIVITFTSALETNNYTYIQVFNLLLRSCLRYMGLKLIQRNYYDSEAKVNNYLYTYLPIFLNFKPFSLTY